MTAAEVNSALANRRSVQIAYSRSDRVHRIAVVVGSDVELALANVEGDTESSSELAEVVATHAARHFGLDVTRVDVP
jgi:hypothetical protein